MLMTLTTSDREPRRTIFDIETNGLLPEVTFLWCIVCRDVETEEVHRFGPENLGAGVDYLLASNELIGHNIINYDLPCLVQLGWLTWARLAESSVEKFTDTLVLSRLMHTTLGDKDRIKMATPGGHLYMPPKLQGSHSLKAWGYRLGELKGDHIEQHGFAEYSEEMMTYCTQDTRVTALLLASLLALEWNEKCITLEHDFAWCLQRMEANGFSFDLDAARSLYVTLSTRKLDLLEQLKVMFADDKIPMKTHLARAGGRLFPSKKAAKEAGFSPKMIDQGPCKQKIVPFNPGSRDHIADRLQRLGWKPTEFTKEGKPKVDETVLSTIKLTTKQESVELLNEYLLLVKRMGMLAEGQQAWLKLEVNGRMHGRVNTNGAVTGRCTHSNPNMAQVPRVGSPYGLECRSLFKASKGMVLVGCDAAGLELRCLAHYLAPYDGGTYAENILKADIHTVNQEAAGLPTRDAAKTFIYAFLYGAGDTKIGEIISQGRAAGKKIKQKFLRSLPALAKLKTCVTSACSGRAFLRGLDGRHLAIRSEHAALNTLLQAAGAVVMKQATVLLYEQLTHDGLIHGQDWSFVAHVHDEFQLEVLPEHVEKVKQYAVESIRNAGDVLNFRCPLDGEAKAGANWAETH
jgi:DNA polymerase-1